MAISKVYVPAEGDPKAKLWIVGEAPGANEEFQRRPFVGESGNILEQTLLRHGVQRSEVFITNLAHYRPPGNKFEALLGSQQLQEGLDEIAELLSIHAPNCIAALGGQPLSFLCNKDGIHKYRGSILPLDRNRFGELERKVIPTYHPAYVLRERSDYIKFDVDFARIVSDSRFPELRLPERKFVIDPDDHEYWIEYLTNAEYNACDIEAVKGSTKILCIGFSPSPDLCVCFPHREDGRTRDTITRILAGRQRKVFHFGTYDVTVLTLNGYDVRNYTDDTIIQAHVLAPELPRDLAYLTSIETREPYYKEEGRKNIPGDIKGWSAKRSKEDLYVYNCRDCCVTYEIHQAQMRELCADEDLLRLYLYEMEAQEAAIELGLEGFLVDQERLNQIKGVVERKRAKLIIFTQKLAGRPINVGSNKQMTKLLYEDWKLPKRVKTNRKTGKTSLTADEDAIVSLISYTQQRIEEVKKESTKHEYRIKLHFLKLVIQLRGTEKLLSSYINIRLHDGKVKSLWKVPGTETGRWSAVKFVDGSGFNLQTVPRDPVEED